MIAARRINRHAVHAEKAAFSMRDTAFFTVIKQTGEEERGDAERETIRPLRKEIADQCRDSEYETKDAGVVAKRSHLHTDDQRCADQPEQQRRDGIHSR